MKFLFGKFFIVLIVVAEATAISVKKHPIDNVQMSYLNNKKVQNFIQDPTNTFSFLTTPSFVETPKSEVNPSKPIDTIIKFLRSITPAPSGSSIKAKNNQCWSNPCLNGASCYGSVNSYLCVCVRGYTGLNCGEKMRNYKECSAEFCNSNGFCQIKALSSPLANLKFCNCRIGFTGQHCEIEIRPSFNIEFTDTTVMHILQPTRTTQISTTTTLANKSTEAEKLYKKLSNIKTKAPRNRRATTKSLGSF
jgi:hypothetical protein